MAAESVGDFVGEFAGKTALVTGASRGIGRAVALELARHGARVALNYQRRADAATAVQVEIVEAGCQAIVVAANVADEGQVAAMIEQVERELGTIDLLVNNAGVSPTGPHESVTYEQWQRVMGTNLDGPFLTTWAVKDGMIERRFGRIVNVASIAGLHPRPLLIDYATSKAALISFTRHCAAAFGPDVRVNCVAPGLVDTDMARSAPPELLDTIVAGTFLQRQGRPEDIAGAVRFLLSDEAAFVTGQTLVADGGR